MMKKYGYDCRFSVLAIPNKPDMFMMNMQVYDVVAQRVMPEKLTADEVSKPVSVVWCAVFNTKGLRIS